MNVDLVAQAVACTFLAAIGVVFLCLLVFALKHWEDLS